MSQPPPASLLVRPDLRRRLQQRYEEAVRLAQRPQPDRSRIHALLAECLAADPGNILYLNALVANLQLWDRRASRSWLPQWLWRPRQELRGASRGQVVQPGQASGPNSVSSAQYELLRGAAEDLLADLDEPATLRRLAEAAGDCGFDQAELRYWQLAATCAPDDPEIVRGLARALTWQGRFQEAAAAWRQLEARVPQDAETEQALADLEAEAAAQYEQADRALLDAAASAGTSLNLIQQREQLQCQRSEHRLVIARQRARHDPHPRAAALALQLETEHNRLEIDIFHLQAERLPQDAAVRVELARRLKRAGNFSGAVQRLEEARRLRGEDAEVLVELGECWQHLRQFGKALDFYRQAIADHSGGERVLLARYRAGVLAAAMGQAEEARGHFAAVLSADPAYKDARQRLDKLPPK